MSHYRTQGPASLMVRLRPRCIL